MVLNYNAMVSIGYSFCIISFLPFGLFVGDVGPDDLVVNMVLGQKSRKKAVFGRFSSIFLDSSVFLRF